MTGQPMGQRQQGQILESMTVHKPDEFVEYGRIPGANILAFAVQSACVGRFSQSTKPDIQIDILGRRSA